MATSLEFQSMVRSATEMARKRGLVVPDGFKSPPSSPGTDRSIRYNDDGSSIVAIRLRGRSAVDVGRDIVDAISVVNDGVWPRHYNDLMRATIPEAELANA